MATLKLGEVVVDAVISKLRAGYAARVANINAEKDDGITVAVPQTGDFFFGGATGLPRSPAVIVSQLPTDGEHEAEGPHSFTWVGYIRVYAYETDSDRSVLARKLERHIRAIVEVLWDDDPKEALAGSAFHVRFVRDDPGLVSRGDELGAIWAGTHYADFRCEQSEN